MGRVCAFLSVALFFCASSWAVQSSSDQFARGLGFRGWTEFQRTYPGGKSTRVRMTGTDLRMMFGKIIPDFDTYFQDFLDQLDNLTINSDKGRTTVEATLVPDGMTFVIPGEATGQRIYAARLSRTIHLEVTMHKDNLLIEKIKGLTLYAKIPIAPDGILPRRLELNTETEKLSIEARVVGGLFKVVATADIRKRKFNGINWWATLFRNLFFWADVLPTFGSR